MAGTRILGPIPSTPTMLNSVSAGDDTTVPGKLNPNAAQMESFTEAIFGFGVAGGYVASCTGADNIVTFAGDAEYANYSYAAIGGLVEKANNYAYTMTSATPLDNPHRILLKQDASMIDLNNSDPDPTTYPFIKLCEVTMAAGPIVTAVDNNPAGKQWAMRLRVRYTQPSNARAGDLWYDTATQFLKYYNGTAWIGVGGSFLPKRTTVADAGYTALAADYLIAYTSISAARTVALPAAASNTNKIYIIKDESGSVTPVNYIRLDPNGAETLDGAATVDITAPYGMLRIYCNGTGWFSF